MTATTKELLNLVAAMNALKENIDPCYAKMAVNLKEGEGDNAVSVRYFIKSRPTMSEDGIERWSFIARQENC